MRALAVLACCLLSVQTASAETVDANVRQLASGNAYRVRLAAAASLAKTKEPRAVIALANALRSDSDATIRRVSALALEKNIDAQTAPDARELGLSALDYAAQNDKDSKVRETATKALKSLAGLRKKPKATPNAPAVFVNIDNANVDPSIDHSGKLPSGWNTRLTKLVKSGVERTGYATSWPGGLPTSADLSSSRSRAFIVAASVKKLAITRAGSQTEIACTVVLRVAPWSGTDGGERWEANKAASASGSAKATTGSRDKDIQNGVWQCVEAVAEDVTSRQIVPFLKRVASAGT